MNKLDNLNFNDIDLSKYKKEIATIDKSFQELKSNKRFMKKFNRWKRRHLMNKEYALYKGDLLLGIGTIMELAKQFKVKPKTLFYYQTPTYQKRTSEIKGRRLVKLDE